MTFVFEKGHAQNSTRSPYSYSGIGDISYPGFAQHVGMGRTGRANQCNGLAFLDGEMDVLQDLFVCIRKRNIPEFNCMVER